jgi:hypothetical protein
MNHYPNALRSLRARLDHRPHPDQPQGYDQISSHDHNIELNTNRKCYCDHDIGQAPTFQTYIQQPDYDLFHITFGLLSSQQLDLDPSSTGPISSQRPDTNPDLTQHRPDRNAITDLPSHHRQLRARSRNRR